MFYIRETSVSSVEKQQCAGKKNIQYKICDIYLNGSILTVLSELQT